MRALLFGVHIRAPDFRKLPEEDEGSRAGKRASFSENLHLNDDLKHMVRILAATMCTLK